MKIPDFDVLSETAEETANRVVEKLKDAGIQKVKVYPNAAIGEIVAKHYQILIGNETIAIVYEPIACHSYNKIYMDDQHVKIATIDTMLTFFLAFYYLETEIDYRDRILCMADILFEVQQQNRLSQKDVLKRFSTLCYGKQKTLVDIKEEKSEKFLELKNKRSTKEYDMWFLNYNPSENKQNEKNKKPMKLIEDKTTELNKNKFVSKYKSESEFESESESSDEESDVIDVKEKNVFQKKKKNTKTKQQTEKQNRFFTKNGIQQPILKPPK